MTYAAALGAQLSVKPADTPRAFFTSTGASSTNGGWTTPPALGAQLNAALGRFDLDPCAPDRNGRTAPIKARVRLTSEDDGLAAHWSGLVYVNPPYGRVLPRWLEKCRTEAEVGARVLALVPARTDTRWWHEHVAGRADVFLLRGRLKFGDQHKDAPFPSALVAWRLEKSETKQLCEAFTDAAYISARRRLSERLDPEKFEPSPKK